MLGKSKTQRIYKAVRNYLYNELQVNKSYVDKMIAEYIDKRVKHEVHQKLENIEEIICDKVAYYMQDKNFYDRRATLYSLIYDEIRKSIHEKIDGKLTVEVKLEK